MQMIRPYVQEIDLGSLKAGTYKVLRHSKDGEEVLGYLDVAMATGEKRDDFLYAPVSSAQVRGDRRQYFVSPVAPVLLTLI